MQAVATTTTSPTTLSVQCMWQLPTARLTLPRGPIHLRPHLSRPGTQGGTRPIRYERRPRIIA